MDTIQYDFAIKRVITNCMNKLLIKKVLIEATNKQIVANKKNAIPNQISISLISAQQPKSIYSKTAIAAFQLRKQQFFGWKITLRKLLMKQFLNKLILIALPQQKEFDALNQTMIGTNGNCHLGYDHLLIFPELQFHFNALKDVKGMNIALISNSKNRQHVFLLLSGYQIPIKVS